MFCITKRYLTRTMYCTMKRITAQSKFESDLAKLQAIATLGKTMEQVRHRINVRLICDPHKLTKAVSKVTFRHYGDRCKPTQTLSVATFRRTISMPTWAKICIYLIRVISNKVTHCTRCKTTEYWGNSKVRRDRKHRQIFLGLRAKIYSLNVPNQKKQSKIRAKGIKRSYVKKHVRHQQFLDVLKTQKSTQSHFRTFRSKNHTLQTVEISKTCLEN